MADTKDPKAKAAGDPQVEVIEDAKPETPEVGVTVNLNPSASAKEPKEDKDDERLQKMERRLEYQARQFEKGLRQLNEVAQTLSSNRTVQNQTNTGRANDIDEDLDKIAEQDWKKAVDILAERRTKKALEEYENRQRLAQEAIKKQSELEESKARVLKECPQIEDENSEEAATYIQVLNEDPKLLSNPRGPELAMYRMRERLQQKPKQETLDIDKEVQRRTRVASAYVAPGVRPTSNHIVLTKSEQQYCDSQKIPYEQYAKMKSYDSARLKEGVEAE